jgi:hypothetical protein
MRDGAGYTDEKLAGWRVRMPRASLSILVLAVLLPTAAAGQTATQPLNVNYCDVVASPADYNQKILSIEVVLSPSFHSLFLYGVGCVPREDYDVTTEAVLPTSWESLPNGKRLRAFLKHGRNAKVTVVGTFEGGEKRYGLDGQRFRFSISHISSVLPDSKASPSDHSK